jgi:UDP-3-O-[3-hydroxymyristoyl] glucosamine N-acyltransferase
MDHISIGDGAMIGPGSGLYKSVEPGEIVSGKPAMPHRQWLKTLNVMPQLPSMLDRIRKLEKKSRQIEKAT